MLEAVSAAREVEGYSFYVVFSYISQSVGNFYTGISNALKILTAFLPWDWRRPPGCSYVTRFKTIQQELKSKNLFLNEAIDMTQNRPLYRDCCLRLELRTPSGACWKNKR